MAALRFTLGPYGNAAQTTVSAAVDAHGEFATSGTAAFIEDGAGDIEATGHAQVLVVNCTGDVWLAFGGATAEVGTEHFIPADITTVLHVSVAGKISVIDDS